MDKPTKIQYCEKCGTKIEKIEITHKPKPIKISTYMKDVISKLLWYTPNNKHSKQSYTEPILEDKLYEDFCFDYILNNMEVDPQNVTLIKHNKFFDNIETPYRESACRKCQVIFFQTDNDQTKTETLIRHIRNSVSHGYFNIIYGDTEKEDMFVGFDETPSGKCTAILHIQPVKLLNAIDFLTGEYPQLQEMLTAHALKKCGYKIGREEKFFDNNSCYEFDIIAEKNGKTYCFEIKDYKSKYIPQITITSQMLYYKNVSSQYNFTPVLLCDKSLLTEQTKQLLKGKNIIVLDRNCISNLLSGIDVLENISQGN